MEMEARLAIHLAGRRFSSSSSRCRKPSKNVSPSIGLTRPPLISSYRLSSISRVSDSSFKYPAIASSTSSSGARPVFAASSCRRDSVSGRRWTSMGVVYTRVRDSLQNLRHRRPLPDHHLVPPEGGGGRITTGCDARVARVPPSAKTSLSQIHAEFALIFFFYFVSFHRFGAAPAITSLSGRNTLSLM
jgi:hypothetical protein